MTVQEPHGPFILCYDGSDAARHAIGVSPGLVGPRRAARVVYVYKPTEMSFGGIQGVMAVASTPP